MTIIEREIEKREALIAEKTAKADEARALREKADLLDIEVANIDEVALKSEVEELRGYLPAVEACEPEVEQSEPVEVVEPETEEIVSEV